MLNIFAFFMAHYSMVGNIEFLPFSINCKIIIQRHLKIRFEMGKSIRLWLCQSLATPITVVRLSPPPKQKRYDKL